MELDQLRNVLHVARHGNFTRAAEDALLSQSALSRSIARLEEELGQPLFERQTRQVVPTEAGSVLIARARQILGLVDDVCNEIADDGRTGRIRVAAIPTIAPFFLPVVLRQFAGEFPEAKVVVYEDTTDVLLRKLAEGELDVAIMALPLQAKHLEVEPLFTEELLVVMALGHPLSEKKQLRLADLESCPFVLLGEAHCLTTNIVQFCERKAIHPVSVEKTSQLASVQELVSLDHGISLIPEMARLLDTSDQRVYRSLAKPKPTREIVMAWNPYRYKSRLLDAFLGRLRSFAGNTARHVPGSP